MFIIGESYAGIYIPTLAARIIDGQNDFDINLKGIAIGNGFVSAKLSKKTKNLHQYYHGVIDEATWESIQNRTDCCDETNGDDDECDPFCYLGKSVATNFYDLHSKCSLDDEQTFRQMIGITNNRKTYMKNRFTLFNEKRAFTSKKVTPSQECVPRSSLQKYFNLPEVQKALHVSLTNRKWEMCNDEVHVLYKKQQLEQSNNVKKIVKNRIRALLYYGDMDSVCNFLMGQQFSDQLAIKKIAKKTAWFYDNRIVDGYKTVYENLTFLTINGAGHMVPQTHPRQMQHVLQQFIKGETI